MLSGCRRQVRVPAAQGKTIDRVTARGDDSDGVL